MIREKTMNGRTSHLMMNQENFIRGDVVNDQGEEEEHLFATKTYEKDLTFEFFGGGKEKEYFYKQVKHGI